MTVPYGNFWVRPFACPYLDLGLLLIAAHVLSHSLVAVGSCFGGQISRQAGTMFRRASSWSAHRLRSCRLGARAISWHLSAIYQTCPCRVAAAPEEKEKQNRLHRGWSCRQTPGHPISAPKLVSPARFFTFEDPCWNFHTTHSHFLLPRAVCTGAVIPILYLHGSLAEYSDEVCSNPDPARHQEHRGAPLFCLHDGGKPSN